MIGQRINMRFNACPLPLPRKGRKRFGAIGLLLATLASMPSAAASTLAVVSTRMPVAQQNASYRFKIYASGGTAPYTWSVDGLAGSGLTASPAGIISGVP